MISSDVFEANAPDPSGLAKLLLSRICETPAKLQHPQCLTQTSTGATDEQYTGYVTPGRKQYWAMFPEYFLKSYNVEFEFSPKNGPIKICYRRGYPKPEDDERNCQKLNAGEIVTFRSTNPCYKYDLSNCHPFYFTIIGLSEGAASSASQCKKTPA